MKPIILKCFILLLVFCGVANAYKGVVFQDNFENVPAITLPNTTVDADPSAQMGLWWGFQYESQPYAIQVADNAVPGTAGDGSKFLHYERLTGGEYVMGYLTHTVDNSEIVTVEFDYYCPSGQSDAKGLVFATMSGTSFAGTNIGNMYVINTFMYYPSWGGFRILNGATYLTPAGSQFAENTWHRVRYDIDLTAETYDLTISGVTYEDIAFRVASGVAANGKMTMVYFGGYVAGTSYYLDNVVVTGAAPEPGPEIAGKLFFDDFEGVDAVEWPDPSQEADPVAQIGTWGVLDAVSSTGTHLPQAIQVSNNSVPGPAEGNNYVSFDRTHYSLMVANWLEEKDTSEDVVLVEFDLCVPSTCYLGPSIGIQEWTTYSGLDPAILAHFFYSSSLPWSGGTGGLRFVYYTANSDVYATPSTVSFRADVWHHVRFEIDIASNTYTVVIAGIRYENIPFRKAADSLGHMYIGGYAAGAKAHFDNFTAGITGTICTSPIRADLDGDCMVNFDDLTIFTNYWLTDNKF